MNNSTTYKLTMMITWICFVVLWAGMIFVNVLTSYKTLMAIGLIAPGIIFIMIWLV